MKLLVIILNKTEALEYLLEGLSAAGIGGATIIRSTGMAATLLQMNSSFLSSSIRSMFTGDDDDNRTILSVINNDQLDIARRVVYNTVGDLSHPNTGIMFTVPLDFVEGRRKRRGNEAEDDLPDMIQTPALQQDNEADKAQKEQSDEPKQPKKDKRFKDKFVKHNGKKRG